MFALFGACSITLNLHVAESVTDFLPLMMALHPSQSGVKPKALQ